MLPLHDRAIILASGDEIITGQLLDTNTQWIAQRLVELGIMPVEFCAAPDELRTLVGVLRRACGSGGGVPLVIMSGGLGPTEGDLTRAALAEVMGEDLVLDKAADAAITAMLRSRGREVSERQRRQAYRPRSAQCLPNGVGTAPGLHAVVHIGTEGATELGEIGGARTDVFCLPGPPGELRPMWEKEVVPRLRPDPSRVVVTRLLHVVGLAEAECVERLGDLTKRQREPGEALVGITASGGILTLRVRCERAGGRDADDVRAAAIASVDAAESRIRETLGDHVFSPSGGDPESVGAAALARQVLGMLKARGEMLGVVESCTGGMLGEMLTGIPGSSAAFAGGFVTYANAMKERLGVDAGLLQAKGAVSAEVAEQMARHGLKAIAAGGGGTNHCLAITGIAGPDGGSAAKPVGLVYIGLACPGDEGSADVQVRRFVFSGGREDVRRRACTSALGMLYFAVQGRPPGEPRMLWESAREHG